MIEVSIAIATRNRKDHVLRAVESALAQDYAGKEVMVFDGGSSDGTVQAITHRFPEVRLFQSGVDPGFVAARNLLVREARGSVVVQIDDDAYFTSGGSLAHIVRDLDGSEPIAALALPFIVPPDLAGRIGVRPARPGQKLANVTGCACAFKKRIALEVGPFPEVTGLLREDRAFSLRLLDSGYEIVLTDCAPIVHLQTPARDWGGRFRQDVVSTLLFDWIYVPAPYVAARLVKDIGSLLIYRAELRDLPRRISYVIQAIVACARNRALRAPVSRSTWRKYRSLPAHGPMPWEGELPPPLRRGQTGDAKQSERNGQAAEKS